MAKEIFSEPQRNETTFSSVRLPQSVLRNTSSLYTATSFGFNEAIFQESIPRRKRKHVRFDLQRDLHPTVQK